MPSQIIDTKTKGIHSPTINAIRGDTIVIPIEKPLIATATYRCHLRQSPDSTEYFVLLVEGTNIIITPQQSAMLNGVWYAELEENNDGEITTLQRIPVSVKKDITHTFGEEAPTWTPEQSVEVAEIIAKKIWIRTASGALVQVGANAYQLAVAEGFNGTEAQWLASLKVKGDPGSTAYQIAVTNGFQGTEAQWLESLKVKGDTGPAWQLIQVPNVVITSAGWTLVNGLYEKVLTNANITALKAVDVIPDNSAFDVISEAVIYPRTESSEGSVKIFALNIPTADFTVTLNIY